MKSNVSADSGMVATFAAVGILCADIFFCDVSEAEYAGNPSHYAGVRYVHEDDNRGNCHAIAGECA